MATTGLPGLAVIVCSLVPSVGLVTCSRQGARPSFTSSLYLPEYPVVAVPVPTAHLQLTVTSAMAKPVAAVPVMVRPVDEGLLSKTVIPPPPPPQAVMARSRASAETGLKEVKFTDFPERIGHGTRVPGAHSTVHFYIPTSAFRIL